MLKKNPFGCRNFIIFLIIIFSYSANSLLWRTWPSGFAMRDFQLRGNKYTLIKILFLLIDAPGLHILITPGDFPLITSLLLTLELYKHSQWGGDHSGEYNGEFFTSMFSQLFPDIGLIFWRLSGHYPGLKYNTYI